VSADLVVLAILMGVVTYPSRAIPLLAPGIERLPPRAHLYLRLIGPAVLASLGTVYALVVTSDDGTRSIQIGVEVLAVALCVAIVIWRRNLLLGLIVAVAVVAVARAAGLA
jgi:branched-subunit amino acid transport protein